MKSIVQVSKWFFVGLLVVAAAWRPVRGDTNTTYTVSFESYTLGGTTYSPDSLTYREGEALRDLPSTAVMPWVSGWYTGENGKGTLYFDQMGHAQVATYNLETDLTLYPKLNSDYQPLGVRVNGQELDGMTEAGQRGAGWSFDFNRRLVTLNAESEYVLTGCQTNNNVHFQVTTNATLKLNNLTLASTNRLDGLIAVSPGAKVTIELTGLNQLDASKSVGLAGICCPSGATVVVTSSEPRNITWTEPVNQSSNGKLVTSEVSEKVLVVKGGQQAAAIGGRAESTQGVSGRITIDNCSIWTRGGTGAFDVGPGKLATGVNSNCCATIYFLNCPNVCSAADHRSQTAVSVYPAPHNKYDVPLFPVFVTGSDETLQRSVYNVYWFPYGNTTVEYTMWRVGPGTVRDTGIVKIDHSGKAVW